LNFSIKDAKDFAANVEKIKASKSFLKKKKLVVERIKGLIPK
jgi:hypothetical protein